MGIVFTPFFLLNWPKRQLTPLSCNDDASTALPLVAWLDMFVEPLGRLSEWGDAMRLALNHANHRNYEENS